MRPEIIIGSNGSWVPEIVIPRGPPLRATSTVYTTASGSSGTPSSVSKKERGVAENINAHQCYVFYYMDDAQEAYQSHN